jgi:hypothetical protein
VFIKQTTNKQTFSEPNNSHFTQPNTMVCQICHCSGHNKRTCHLVISPAEQRVAAQLGAILPAVADPVEHIGGQRLVALEEAVEEVRQMFAAGARLVTEPKVVSRPLEGLAGCKNIFKEPKVVKTKKAFKTCASCGEKGHNSRTCRVNLFQLTCLPCPPPKAYCFAGLSAKQATTMARIMDCTPVIN